MANLGLTDDATTIETMESRVLTIMDNMLAWASRLNTVGLGVDNPEIIVGEFQKECIEMLDGMMALKVRYSDLGNKLAAVIRELREKKVSKISAKAKGARLATDIH